MARTTNRIPVERLDINKGKAIYNGVEQQIYINKNKELYIKIKGHRMYIENDGAVLKDLRVRSRDLANK